MYVYMCTWQRDPQGHFLNAYWKCASLVGGASGVPGNTNFPCI